MSEGPASWKAGMRVRSGPAAAWIRRNQVLRRILPVLTGLVFVGAVWLIYGQLEGFEYAAVGSYLSGIPTPSIALAVVLTGVNFGIITGYDALALRYVNVRLSRRRLLFSAFVGYSVSQAIGSPLLTGGSIRYRLYSNWGLAPGQIGKAILFAGLSFWLGFLTLGGALFVLQPVPLPPSIDLPVAAAVLGLGCLVLPLLYVGVTVFGTRPIRLWIWEFERPPGWMLPAQVGLAVADLLVATGVLFILLPPSVSVPFGSVVPVYVVGLLVGVVSHVPGGLGVFDSIVLTVLSTTVEPPVVVGALLAYRGIFHLLPLTLAGGALATYELRRRT